MRKLEKNMKLRMLVGSFQGIGQIVSYIGPIGAAAGSAIQTATSVGSSFIVDPDMPEKQFTMSSDIHTTFTKIATAITEKQQSRITALEKEIDNLNKALDEPENSNTVSADTKKIIANIKTELSF